LAVSCFLLFTEGPEVALDLQRMSEFRRLAEEGADAEGHAGVMDRCPSAISLIARGGTPMARAAAF
jgi:hypothetical protein